MDQDDRVCAYITLAAMLEMEETPKRTGCCLLVDKEEIGSVGATGMQSRFFENQCGRASGWNGMLFRACPETRTS